MDSESLTEALEETLATFEAAGTPLSTTEVADVLGLGRRSTYERLQRLVDRDRLETKTVGASARVWWRTGENCAAEVGEQDRAEERAHDRRIRDVTERNERDRDLEEHRRWSRTLVDNFPSGAVSLVDRDMRYVIFGGTLGGDNSLTAADLQGEPVREALPEPIAEVVAPRYEAALDGERSEFESALGDRIYRFTFIPVRDDDGEVFAVTAMSQDVTDHRERERELEESEGRYRKLVEHFPNGMVGLFDEDLRYTLVGGGFFDGYDLAPSTLVGERARTVVDDPAIGDRLETAYRGALAGEESSFEIAWGGREWAVEVVPVTADDGTVFAGMLVGRDVTEDRRRERELERQREQLAALNNLNEVVRDITDAVVDRSSRAEIEEAVCERLAASDSYLFAWTGEVDTRSRTVELRTEAGVEGYLEDATIPVDPNDDGGVSGPTVRALLEREIQTERRLDPDDDDPWTDRARRYGYRSAAVIPVVHEDTVYGVLNVYSERPDAFADRERDVIGGLGEVVGHAIAAADRKRALLSDEVVELRFRLPNVLDAVGVEGASGGRIALDHFVPLRDDEYLVYGRATDGGADTVRALVEAIPHWREATFRDDGEHFELRLDEPPVLSTSASLGGSFEGAVVEEGDYRMTFHLPTSVDAGRLIDVVRDSYPTASLVRRRQIPRADSTGGLRDVLDADLTDRQRTALEAAYHAGFFEWPRAAAGEDVAASLGVAGSTFHQHLRKAEGKVFGSLLSGEPRAP